MLVAQPKSMTNRKWIAPPNTIIDKGTGNSPQKLSYWTDKDGKAKLYTKEQLATCNILMNLNFILVRALILLDTLKTMDEDTKVGTLIHQDYAKFEATKHGVFSHFVNLMAAVPDITFGEFLNFLSANNNSQDLAKMGQKTLKEVIKGNSPNITTFYTSDRLTRSNR